MGVCGTKPEDDEKVVEDQTDNKAMKSASNLKTEKQEKPTTTQSEEKGSDFDFRETLKGVVLLILDRLVTALEYEQEGFMDLAAKRSKKNYLELIAPQHFDKLLRETFDIDSSPPAQPDVEQSDPNYEQQRYLRLIEACVKAPFRSPVPSGEKFATAIQKAAKLTQKELRESAISSDSSDLKIHLFFFAKALDVIDGDIISHHELLFSNIDDMCDKQ